VEGREIVGLISSSWGGTTMRSIGFSSTLGSVGLILGCSGFSWDNVFMGLSSAGTGLTSSLLMSMTVSILLATGAVY
jgi:hypothetical protein